MTESSHTHPPKKLKIFVVGDGCRDEYLYGTVDRISPEAPIPVFRPEHSPTVRFGMAHNVVDNLRVLGCEVTSMTGDDSVKTRLIDRRSKQQIVRIDNDMVSAHLNLASVDFNAYDAIVISDYDKGAITYQTVEQIRNRFSGPIMIDTKKTDLRRFEGCFVKINEVEMARAVSLCTNVIVTLGREGAMYRGVKYPAVPLDEIVDVCGAGDTFLASLTYQYLVTGSIEQAIAFANAASSVAVRHMGVYAPTHEEIQSCG